MDSSAVRFYPGSGQPAVFPLARYLPPLPAGAVSAWLAEHVAPGGWVLDPLGMSPALALEAARAGYRVLVASNNPILSFTLETLAGAPRGSDFQAALAELAASKRGDERMEKYLQSLYLTECEKCGEHVPAQAFLWRKGESQPFARIYRCPRCGESPTGERPVTQADLNRLAAMGGDKMQRSRALQRVVMNDDEHRADVEEALENYLPRPLYVLFTLMNKIEGLGLPPERVRLLQALILSTLDAGSTLWPWPGGRSRPRQLTVPPQFRENNLWMALEEAAGEWTQQGAAVPLVRWPNVPPKEGGISLFRGRVKALAPLPPEIGPQAVVTVFPRPNQAFWTLSVLWAGWLWGAEAALPLRNVLDRRRYDWNWHTSAVHNALAAVGWSLPEGTPFFGLLPELVPGFLSAVTVAAQAAGFQMEGLALRAEQEMAQGLWRPSGGKKEETAPEEAVAPADGTALERAAREAMRETLLARNEPAPYLTAYAAGLQGLIRGGAVSRSLNNIPGDLLTRVQAILARTFADRSFLRVFGGQAEEERGWWWLTSPPALPGGNGQEDRAQELAGLPLSDRVEIEVVRFLQKQPVLSFEALDRALCAQFTGLHSPSQELSRACLESYGEMVTGQAGVWRMRTSETASARKTDLQEMQATLEALGQRLGFRLVERAGEPGIPLAWVGQDGDVEWRFYRMASSIISRYVLAPLPGPPERLVLLLPGSRARLLSFRLRRDPRLAAAARDWQFLKFRHLREIAEHENMTVALWESLLEEDPLTDEATQMPLFT